MTFICGWCKRRFSMFKEFVAHQRETLGCPKREIVQTDAEAKP